MRLKTMVVFCLVLAFSFSVAYAQVDKKKAATQAYSKIKALNGFVATYRGESSQSDARPEIYIGYAKPDKMFIRVPMMKFYAAHEPGVIRIQSDNSGVMMPLDEVRAVSMAAQKGLASLKWIGLPDPATAPMQPRLTFELADRTLNVGISFGDGKEPFSWLLLMRTRSAVLTEDKDFWKCAVDAKEGGKYSYWISKNNGVLEKLIHTREGKTVRSLTLVDLKLEPPHESLFTNVFGDQVTPERFGKSPQQKAQYLVGLYGGLQEVIISDTVPKWSGLETEKQKLLAGAVSIYWKEIFKYVFQAQSDNLKAALDNPTLEELVKKAASDKAEYEKFVTDLPAEKAAESKKLWEEQVLGQVGYELLDPFVGWARDQFVVRAKQSIDKLGPKHGLTKDQQDTLLGIVALPIIDACYTTAEPIVLPKLMPMIQKATKELE